MTDRAGHPILGHCGVGAVADQREVLESAPLPTGGHINQSNGTAWMAMYSLNLMRIALELAQRSH